MAIKRTVSKQCKVAGKKAKTAKTKKVRKTASHTLASDCKKQANRWKRLHGVTVYKKKKTTKKRK